MNLPPAISSEEAYTRAASSAVGLAGGMTGWYPRVH